MDMNRLYAALFLLSAGLAQPVAYAPLPKVQPLGTVQPVAPGFQKAPPLPQIVLNPLIPQVRRLEYASNGFIEAAHALVLLPQASARLGVILPLAQSIASRTFTARPSLAVVDISVYQAEGYAGYGGPLPLFTASVAKVRLGEFARLTPATVASFDHLWVNPDTPHPPLLAPTGATSPSQPEELAFAGDPEELKGQQEEQVRQSEAGPANGLVYHGDPARPQAALTFDDAPHPLYAPLLLDALRRTGAKATFFVVGRNAEAYPYFVRDLAREGHEIANHTYHHVRLVGLTPAQVAEELERNNRLLQAITGETPVFFRPPGGRYSAEVLRAARAAGLSTAFWTDDPADFNNPGALTLETRLLGHLRPGGIVLLHDNAQQTVGLLADFINDARTTGIRLVTLETLVAPR
jgi:peptidoglycan/xylan/chitin deacetylase (PgdA/CDA1 family)